MNSAKDRAIDEMRAVLDRLALRFRHVGLTLVADVTPPRVDVTGKDAYALLLWKERWELSFDACCKGWSSPQVGDRWFSMTREDLFLSFCFFERDPLEQLAQVVPVPA